MNINFSLSPLYLSCIGNALIMLALVFQLKGKLYLSFPASLMGSLIFTWYGIVTKDNSFIFTNLLFFIPFNLIGAIKWIIKHRRKEVINA